MRHGSYIETLILNLLHYAQIASVDVPEKLRRHDLMESCAACLQTHHRCGLIYQCELDCERRTLSMNYDCEIYLGLRCKLFPTAHRIGKCKSINFFRFFYWSVIQAVGFFDFIDIGP